MPNTNYIQSARQCKIINTLSKSPPFRQFRTNRNRRANLFFLKSKFSSNGLSCPNGGFANGLPGFANCHCPHPVPLVLLMDCHARTDLYPVPLVLLMDCHARTDLYPVPLVLLMDCHARTDPYPKLNFKLAVKLMDLLTKILLELDLYLFPTTNPNQC